MSDELLEWFRDFIDPARDKERSHDLVRKAAALPPINAKSVGLLHDTLRQVDPATLGSIWKEWKALGRTDLVLEAEKEMERRRGSRLF